MANIQVVNFNLLEADPVRTEIFLHSDISSIDPLKQSVVAHDFVSLGFERIHPCVIMVKLQVRWTVLAIEDIKQEGVLLAIVVFLGDVVMEPVIVVE